MTNEWEANTSCGAFPFMHRRTDDCFSPVSLPSGPARLVSPPQAASTASAASQAQGPASPPPRSPPSACSSRNASCSPSATPAQVHFRSHRTRRNAGPKPTTLRASGQETPGSFPTGTQQMTLHNHGAYCVERWGFSLGSRNQCNCQSRCR